MLFRDASAGQGSRGGFTIAEVVVALTLLAVALLGLAGSSSIAVRTTGAALRERRAVQRAADRFAVLRALGCSAARSGAASDAWLALDERWTVAPSTNGVALIDEQVRWRASGRAREFVLRSAILC
jgi:Tfp pilus assembly protein PilV